MAQAAVILAALGAVTGAIGKYQTGKSESNLLEEQGRLAALEAKDKAEQSRTEDRRIMAKARLGYAGSGVTLEGTPLKVLTEQALESELKAQKIRWAGKVENKMRRWGAQQTMRNTYWGMGATLLGGASQTYGQWSKAQEKA